MDTIKTTTHYEHHRFLPHAIDTRAERERSGVAKLEIVTRYGRMVMQLSILFDDALPTDAPYTLLLPANVPNAINLKDSTWPHVELLTPGQFDALVTGWRLAHERGA